MYNTYGKENTKEEEVKGIYILLSGTLAVVTSAVSGTTRSPVVDVRCNLYPKTHGFLYFVKSLILGSVLIKIMSQGLALSCYKMYQEII